MKLSKKIKAIITLLTIAIISVVGAACGGQQVEFKFTKPLPTQVNFGTELYFKDYLPIEYGQDYKLYASYFNVDEQKEVVEEEYDALAFSFDYVADYKFKIVRNGSDTLECAIKSYPQVPRVLEGKVINQTARDTNVQSFERLLIIGYGSLPLENNKEATADPDYEIKATAASFQSVEIDGTDVSSIDVSSGSITINKQGYYQITYTATNRAGSDSAVLTIRTVDANNHVDTLDGYLLENGEGLDDNQLVFDMDSMPAPADGETIRARFGEGKGTNSAIYDAKYDAFTGKYTIDGFKHELTKDKNERIYLEGADGELYSTTVTLPTIITQETIDAAGSPAQLVNATGGYLLLGSDIDLAAYPFKPTTQFTGVLDGDGHVISNITGPEVTDDYGRKSIQGTTLFSQLINATVKNVTLNGVHSETGMLTGRVEKTLRIKNVIARLTSYVGARTSLLGYHAESNENAYVNNVIIEMPTMTVPADGAYVGMLTTHAGGKTYIENLVLVGGNGLIHSTKGNNATFVPKHYTNREDSATGLVELNKDYFAAPSAEVVFNCAQDGYVSDFVLGMADSIGMVVAIDSSNVDRLQTATSGYYYLTEDIDMADYCADAAWLPSGTFNGVLNGDGYKLYNFSGSGENFSGLLPHAGKGATVKNIDIQMVKAPTRAGIFGQLKGETLVSDVNIYIDQIGGAYTGVITNVLQNKLTVKNTNIYIVDSTKIGGSNKETDGDELIPQCSILYGTEAGNGTVIIDNVVAVDQSGKFESIAATRSASGNQLPLTVLGADGESPAVEGVDYIVCTDILDTDESIISNPALMESFTAFKAEKEETAYKIGQANINDLHQIETGYVLLTEDVDLSGMIWGKSIAQRNLVFNGQGHKISNITYMKEEEVIDEATGEPKMVSTNYTTFFGNFGGTIKNAHFHIADMGVQNVNAGFKGLIGQNRGQTLVSNVIIDIDKFDGRGSGAIAAMTDSPITVKDVIVNITEVRKCTQAGVLIGELASESTMTLDNVIINNPSSELNMLSAGATEIIGEEGVDYAMYSDILDYTSADIADADLAALFEEASAIKMATATLLTIDNIRELQTATNGYFYLDGDIDMAGITDWAPTQGTNNLFTGTINGRGYAIKNFTAPASHAGLVGWVGNNATFKNLTVHALTNTSRGILIGQIKGATSITNCTFEVENFDPYLGGVITSVVQGNLTVDNVNVNIKSLKAFNNARAGFLCGGEASSHNVTLSNVFVIDPSGYITVPYTGDNEDKEAKKETALGVDGELAVAGEDYIVVKDILDYDVDSIENEFAKAFAQKAQEKALENVTILTSENITELLTATTGYYVLGEDIDMTEACAVEGGWSPVQGAANPFCGTLNGMGHKLTNFTPNGVAYDGLFDQCGGDNSPAVVKNITIEMTVAPARAGVFGRSIKKGVEIKNSTIIVETDTLYNSSAIVNVVQAPVNIIDTVVVYKSRNNFSTPAYVGSTEANTSAGVITVDNFVVFDLTGVKLPLTTSAGGAVGEEGVNYAILGDFYNVDLEKITSDSLKAFIEEKAAEFKSMAIELTADNFEEFAQATSGYYVLTEDIDLAGKEIAFTEGLKVLNGNGHVIKNSTFKVAEFTSSWGAMLNNVIGETTFVNVIFDVANLKTVAGTTSATIALGVSGDLKLTNCVVSVNNSNFVANTHAGIVVGCLATSGTLTLDNTLIINTNKQLTNIVAARTNGDAVTVEGTYEMQSDVFDINVNALPDGMIKNYVNAIITKAEENATVLTNANIDLLQTATTGYYVLGEDIDMAGKTWAPTQGSTNLFTATLNGRGYSIKNFTAPADHAGLVGFTGAGATFKNLYVHVITNTSKGAITGQIKGATTIENCVIDIDTIKENHGGGIANVVQGTLTVNNVLVNIDAATHDYGVGFVAGREAASHNVIISNGFFVSGDSKISNVYAGDNEDKAALKETTLGTDGELAVAGEDYVVATKLSDIDRNSLTTDLLKSGYDALIG